MRPAYKNWMWLLYPVIVGVFVVVSANYLWSNRQELMQAANSGKGAETEAKIAALRGKLGVLSRVDTAREKADLEYLAKAVLPNKAIWLVVNQLKGAAAEAAVTLTSYRAASGGDIREASDSAAQVEPDPGLVLEVTVSGAALESLARMLASLEKRLPLVRVIKVEYANGSAVLTVEGAWEPWKKAEGDTPLPDFRPAVDEAKQKLSGFALPTFGEEGATA